MREVEYRLPYPSGVYEDEDGNVRVNMDKIPTARDLLAKIRMMRDDFQREPDRRDLVEWIAEDEIALANFLRNYVYAVAPENFPTRWYCDGRGSSGGTVH